MSTPPTATDYRLAPLLVARIVGLILVLLALVMFAATALVAVLSLSGDLLVVVLGLGLAGLFGTAGWLRGRAYVVRLDDDGYRVGLVRGAGVKQGRWVDVERAAAEHPRDVPCLVIHLRDGGTTRIPVEALAVDRDAFAGDVRQRLEQATGRPI